MNKPIIVCLCGSTRFKAEFIKANFDETMKGKIVLTVGWFSHSDSEIYNPTPNEKLELDKLHLLEIDLAHEVLFLDVNGYMGESTRNELKYATSKGKIIRFLSDEEE